MPRQRQTFCWLHSGTKSAVTAWELLSSNEVDRLLESIRRNPRQFKIRYKKHKLRWGLLNRFPYKIVYLLQEDTVHVIAVTHAARHHSAWKRRIR